MKGEVYYYSDGTTTHKGDRAVEAKVGALSWYRIGHWSVCLGHRDFGAAKIYPEGIESYETDGRGFLLDRFENLKRYKTALRKFDKHPKLVEVLADLELELAAVTFALAGFHTTSEGG